MSIIEKYIPAPSRQNNISTINDVTTGSYVITTASGSRYVIDLNNLTLARHADDESDWHGDIRRGSSKRGIVNIVNCTIGQGMVVILDEEIPGDKLQVGVKFTTSVTAIRIY